LQLYVVVPILSRRSIDFFFVIMYSPLHATQYVRWHCAHARDVLCDIPVVLHAPHWIEASIGVDIIDIMDWLRLSFPLALFIVAAVTSVTSVSRRRISWLFIYQFRSRS
jgi:hypothetical protein